jgi:beta-galactosidase
MTPALPRRRQTFRVVNREFRLDGRPFRILAGGMHYFRVMPEQWPHRLRLLRSMGLNTVDTYGPWNFHEPSEGEFLFDGLRNVERFLSDAAEAGLYAIVRPGPYICSEWDNGGLPSWLLKGVPARLRCSDEKFTRPLERWFDELVPRLAPHQVSAGGNIILMQIENDYARYGTDSAYVEGLRDGLRRRGIDTPLYVCEAPAEVGNGTRALGDVLGSVWLEYSPERGLAALAEQCPDDPLFCSEAVCGPIQHWGEPLNIRGAAESADMLDRLLGKGASISLYMAHGGSNFGLWNGANLNDGLYQPSVTSYDYDSPIDERGAPTEKFWLFRNVLSRYAEPGPDPDPKPPATLPPGSIALTSSVSLLDSAEALAGTSIRAAHPVTFENIGQSLGFVLYSTTVRERPGRHMMTIHGLYDRAQIFLGGAEAPTLERGAETSVEIEINEPETPLTILVESLGRVNFAPDLGERKGILGGVRIGWRWVHGWSSVALDIDRSAHFSWGQETSNAVGPIFHRGFFNVDQPLDAFIGLRGWTKGCVWINGFCLGRYWDRGPHHSLYMPGPLLRHGQNELRLLELHRGSGNIDPTVQIRTSHDIG